MPVIETPLEFTLPPELEAHQPPEARGITRDGVRLLVTYRDHDRIIHTRFTELPRFLSPGDLLVVNDSGTLPAEVSARGRDGTSFPLRFSTRLPSGHWTVEPRKYQVQVNDEITLPGNGSVRMIEPYAGSHRLWMADLNLPLDTIPYLLRWGRPIRYGYIPASWPLDAYQTVYHGELGSAEMPSAGRPFSHTVLARLAQRGIQLAKLTLHTGVSSLENQEAPYEEAYRVPFETARQVNAARQAGGRVVAVGTTVVRALETATDRQGMVHPSQGRTNVVITPERGVRAVDALLTGFHEPQATHLAMLEALAGRHHLEVAYAAALQGGYLWHEFGDVHLIL